MIICTITIEEVPGKGYYIDVNPDQSRATAKEMHAAGLFDASLALVQEYILKKTKHGGAIESKDLDAVRGLTEEMIRKFKSV
jgi:hypothetical protein